MKDWPRDWFQLKEHQKLYWKRLDLFVMEQHHPNNFDGKENYGNSWNASAARDDTRGGQRSAKITSIKGGQEKKRE